MIMIIIKQRWFKCIKCMNKGDELYDIPTCCTKFLKYDPFWHWIESICHIQLKNNPIRVKVPWIIASQPPLIITPNWFGENCVTKVSRNWRHKTRLVNWYNVPPIVMGRNPLESFVMVNKHVAPRTHAIWGEMWPYAIWEQNWNNWRNPFVEFLGLK
jgi:hypothetical protein